MNLFNHHFTALDGHRLYLDRYRNVPFLVVNFATENRFIPQMRALQQIYSLNRDAGLHVLAIPCTDFGDEPRNEEEIDEFLRENYPVSFLVTARYSVASRDMHPLFRELLLEHSASILPRSPFYKYLFDRKGDLVKHWPPEMLPDDPGLNTIIQRQLTSRNL